MNLRETFKLSGFESASKVTEVYRFFHKGSQSHYRLEIAQEFLKGHYTATPYREVEDEEHTGLVMLEKLREFPWVEQPTPDDGRLEASCLAGYRAVSTLACHFHPGEFRVSGTESAGINRHIVGDERALRKRRSDSILASSLACVSARKHSEA